MNLCGLMIVRNDDWCLEASLGTALRWCDHMVVLVHRSQDRTMAIVQTAAESSQRVTILTEDDGAWNEMWHRQRTLAEARRLKATHMAIIDSDEVLTANLVPAIRDLVAATPARTCLSLPGIQLWEGLDRHRVDGLFMQHFSLAFLDDPAYMWAARRHEYQHHCRPPRPLRDGHCPRIAGGIMHLQFVRPRALRAKQAKYKMVEWLRWPVHGIANIDRKYSWWQVPGLQLENVPAAWWDVDIKALIDTDDSRPSWHELEIYEMLSKHGRQRFAGLNLFGMEERWSQSAA